ncbi:MAG: murein transglycosylase [Deltaproteobacteria bacterium]|nr:murein transglycosylase [Deltaproteobacteria bacterium]
MRFHTVKHVLFWLGFLLSGELSAAPPPDLVRVEWDQALLTAPFDADVWNRKHEVASALAQNISYLNSPAAEAAYARAQAAPFTATAVRRSLLRFRELLLASRTEREFRHTLRSEFSLYRPRGHDGYGRVHFTGYFRPTYRASRVRTATFRYPIYRRPPNFASWRAPHPTRLSLEGYDGTGNPRGPLKGRELAWLASRYEAFMIHVQGSALLDFVGGGRMAVGFAGATDYPFRGFVDSCLERKPASLTIEQFFRTNPRELDRCLAWNNRFIFFEPKVSSEPIGSLGVPVMARWSVATDKGRLPPGALAIARANLPRLVPGKGVQLARSQMLVLDQDSGGAIQGSGRADLFMGTGPEAERMARAIYDSGDLFYLILRKERL